MHERAARAACLVGLCLLAAAVIVLSSATVTSDAVLAPDSLISRPCGMPGMMTVAVPGCWLR